MRAFHDYGMKSFLRGFVACALALAPADALLAGLPTARACEPRARRCCKPRCTLIEQPPADGVGERLLLLLGELVARSRRIRCPFWRRRAGDAVGAAVAIADFVAARHKSLELPAGLAELLAPAGPQLQKATNLPIEELMTRVATDIEEGQYYISGKLDASIYDDRCFFDGPDPDMPVRSLGRYVDALRGLFDETISRIDLISMHQVPLPAPVPPSIPHAPAHSPPPGFCQLLRSTLAALGRPQAALAPGDQAVPRRDAVRDLPKHRPHCLSHGGLVHLGA